MLSLNICKLPSMEFKRVLIIDSDTEECKKLRSILHKNGYAVTLASSGEAAVRIIGYKCLDYALIEVWLPGMDGLQTAAIIKTRNPGIRIIMMSAQANIELAVATIKRGATHFLEKPLDYELLTSRLALLPDKGQSEIVTLPQSCQ